jgi:aminopeptidase N
MVKPVPPPAPASNAETVAQTSARVVEFFSLAFGPYPYSSLALSQMPGRNSQGWPGLVFLSSYAYLSPEERQQAHLGPVASLHYSGFMQVHEIAHQWWGDLIGWKSYRDQWLMEALANYSAILALEPERPADCKLVLQAYREQLLAKNEEGEEVARAGPVTLGLRLSSSHFPDGYDTVSYGRGAWLLHMLRTMMRDAAPAKSKPKADSAEPFLRALRKLRERYQGKEISTAEFLRVMEEELPDSLRYEGSNSLDWFFEGWVKGRAVPHLQTKDVRFVRRAGAALVTGKILQKEAPDDLVTSVPVYAGVGKKLVLLGRVFADGAETSFRLNAPADAKSVVLDPYGTVLTRP